MSNKERCQWVTDDLIYQKYHDEEWGIPSFDDRYLFEMLTLEGAQAGLSWLTILKRRDNYRKAFANFDIQTVSQYDEMQVQKLLNNKGIIRNELKIRIIPRSEEHTSELQSRGHLVCRLLLEKKTLIFVYAW